MKDKYRLNIPRLNILSRDKLELIHLSTLEVLRRTGVAVKEPKAVEIVKEEIYGRKKTNSRCRR